MTSDPNTSNWDVHYRLYDGPRSGPTVICVQAFDYPDYETSRFLTPEGYNTEDEAKTALRAYLDQRRCACSETLVPLPGVQELSAVIDQELAAFGIGQKVSDYIAYTVIAHLRDAA